MAGRRKGILSLNWDQVLSRFLVIRRKWLARRSLASVATAASPRPTIRTGQAGSATGSQFEWV